MAMRVLSERLSLDAAIDEVRGDDAGALVSFVGTVRNETRGRRVVRLEYEVYRPMALAEFERIGQALASDGVRLAIHHREGVCPLGEPTVVIVAAAPHRAEAFEACRQALERLKRDAPIWKREVYEDGASWVGQGS